MFTTNTDFVAEKFYAVAEEALMRALAKRRLAGATLDVFEHEPRAPREARPRPAAYLTSAGAGFEPAAVVLLDVETLVLRSPAVRVRAAGAAKLNRNRRRHG
mgnify:CR=1 FL=1